MTTIMYGPRMDLNPIPSDKEWYPIKPSYCKICGEEIPEFEFDCPICETDHNPDLRTALNRLRLL